MAFFSLEVKKSYVWKSRIVDTLSIFLIHVYSTFVPLSFLEKDKMLIFSGCK